MELMRHELELNPDVVREHIKTASREASFIGKVEGATHQSHVRNPLCGDEIAVSLSVDTDDHLQDLKAEVRGCLVAKAAWTLTAQAIRGRARPDAIAYLENLMRELAGAGDGADLKTRSSGVTDNRQALYSTLEAPVSSLLSYRLPSPRHSCATLGSQAVLKALQPENCNQ